MGNNQGAFQQALLDVSDYGMTQPQRRVNQEAYQAYYNTSNACNYGLAQNPVPNPYFNNFVAPGVKSPSKPTLNIQVPSN